MICGARQTLRLVKLHLHNTKNGPAKAGPFFVKEENVVIAKTTVQWSL